MNLISQTCCICVLSLALASCQSFSASDVQSHLYALDFNLDSSSYIVRPGETLETIAFRYRTSVSTLERLNPGAAENFYAGMLLNIRQPSQTQPSKPIASWSATTEQAPDSPVEVSPTRRRQAAPIATIATDQYLLGRERYNSAVTESPAIIESPSGGYVQQRGYPVEEIINDDSFVLPNTRAGVNQALQEFVGGWQWPLNGKLAREYDPQRPNGRGIEIVGLPGQEVFATRDGIVDWVARSPDGVGKIVIVRHDDDYLSIYSNAQDLFVSMKDTVRQGDPIASLGANANDEPLLRFEISKNGNMLNPIDYLSPR